MATALIQDLMAFHRAWNHAKSVQEVADHYQCSRTVLYTTKERCKQVYPYLKFKNFPTFDIENIAPKPCNQPTHHLPGTREKVQVFCHRRENEEELFHERDNAVFSGVDTILVRQKKLDLRTGNNVKLKGCAS